MKTSIFKFLGLVLMLFLGISACTSSRPSTTGRDSTSTYHSDSMNLDSTRDTLKRDTF